MAEGLFLHHVKAAGLESQIRVDSCGTGDWHVGGRPDPRMVSTAERHGIDLPSRARQLQTTDFADFDYIIAMDEQNQRDILSLARQAGGGRAEVLKMRTFDDTAPDADVPDPYYGGQQGFEAVYQMLDRSTRALLAHIRTTHGY